MTAYSRVLVEKLIVAHLTNRFSTFNGISRFITAFTRVAILSQIDYICHLKVPPKEQGPLQLFVKINYSSRYVVTSLPRPPSICHSGGTLSWKQLQPICIAPIPGFYFQMQSNHFHNLIRVIKQIFVHEKYDKVAHLDKQR